VLVQVPYGVSCDHQENVYVADHYNDRVSVFTIDGTFLQHLLTSHNGLTRPKSLAIRCTAQDQKLYVAHGGLRSTEVAIYKLYTGRKQSVTFQYDV
jgi:DNA-binding beta-propeller fold protein YncE